MNSLSTIPGIVQFQIHSTKQYGFPDIVRFLTDKNDTFLQKWHIPPKMAHSFKNCTFLPKWHIPPKMAHSSKNGIFLEK